jgi:hypothetical protein
MKMKFLFMALVLTSFVTAQNLPKIFSPKPVHDFGTVLEGKTVTHNFEIVNNGKAELEIQKVSATCGCTAANPVKNKLMPGEKTTIKVEFNSTSRMGPQEKYVYVFSNDKENPNLRLSFSCVVVDKMTAAQFNNKIPKLMISKTSHDFGDVEEGKVVSVKFDIKNSGNDLLKIENVKTTCGCTAALLSSKTIKPGETGDLKIDLDTANREGKLTRTVTIISNDPAQPSQSITLFVNILKRKI